MVLFVILFFLIILVIIRISNNKDLINSHSKNEIDIANIENAKKVFRRSKTSNYFLIGTISIFIVLLLCNFTDIDYKIIDYISADFVDNPSFSYYLYLIPIYLLVIREIFIQVKIGEFILKFFKVEEEEINLKDEVIKPILKSALYKKPSSSNQVTNNVNETKGENK